MTDPTVLISGGHAGVGRDVESKVPVLVRVAHEDPLLEQDALDGEALRLLAEAAKGYALRLGKTPDGKWWFTLWEHGDYVHHDTVFGPIAEAADACRKALEAR